MELKQREDEETMDRRPELCRWSSMVSTCRSGGFQSQRPNSRYVGPIVAKFLRSVVTVTVLWCDDREGKSESENDIRETDHSLSLRSDFCQLLQTASHGVKRREKEVVRFI